MKKVEYMSVQLWNLKNEANCFDLDKLNLLGQKGWELTVIQNGEAIFKRKK